MNNKGFILKKTLTLFACLFVYLFVIGGVNCSYAAPQGIVAVVNEDAISDRDVNSRMRLVIASSGLPDSREIRKKMFQQVLDGLINEQLMLQEASKYGFVVEQKEIDAGMAQIAQQNKMKPEQFVSMLKRGGIDLSTIYRQVEAQVAWSKVVQSRLNSNVIISDRDIDDTLERIKSKIGTTEYFVAEIYLPIDDAKKERQVKNLADSLVSQVRGGKVSFFKLARQFSQAAGAKNGGNKGWVNEAQMPEELLPELKKVNKGQVTRPVKIKNGYHILLLRDKRVLNEENVPSRQQVEYSMGNERLDKLQRQRLMELRLSSFVDIRI